MNWFHFALLCHIVGVLGLFGAIMLELTGIYLLRQAETLAQLQGPKAVLSRLDAIFGPATLLIIASGIYMTLQLSREHRSVGWAWISLVMVVLFAVAGSVAGRRLSEGIRTAMAKSRGRMTSELQAILRDPKTLANGVIGGCTVLGIVVLMIYKPDVIASVVVLLVSIAIGAAAYWSWLLRAARQAASQTKA